MTACFSCRGAGHHYVGTLRLLGFVLCCSFGLAFSANVGPSLRLPSFFGDFMVLQRGNATIWGWVDNATSTNISVDLSIVDNSVTPPSTLFSGSTKADESTGRFELFAAIASTHLNTTVSLTTGPANAVTSVAVLENVAVGDVFLCSGQVCAELSVRSMPPLRVCTSFRVPESSCATCRLCLPPCVVLSYLSVPCGAVAEQYGVPHGQRVLR